MYKQYITIENSKTLKYPLFSIKHQFLLLFVISVTIMIKKILKEKESIQILKIIDLTDNIEERQIKITD